MLYWESNRRLRELKEFRELVHIYFLDSHPSHFALQEGEKARRLRPQINLRLNDILRSMQIVGEPATFSGGNLRSVNALTNIFQLYQLRIPRKAVLDCLDRSIGEYERMQEHLFRQLFNPLYWLGRTLSIPFQILAFAGFDAEKIEHSFFGRLSKAIAGFVALVAAMLTILNFLGWLDRAKGFFHILAPPH